MRISAGTMIALYNGWMITNAQNPLFPRWRAGARLVLAVVVACLIFGDGRVNAQQPSKKKPVAVEKAELPSGLMEPTKRPILASPIDGSPVAKGTEVVVPADVETSSPVQTAAKVGAPRESVHDVRLFYRRYRDVFRTFVKGIDVGDRLLGEESDYGIRLDLRPSRGDVRGRGRGGLVRCKVEF